MLEEIVCLLFPRAAFRDLEGDVYLIAKKDGEIPVGFLPLSH